MNEFMEIFTTYYLTWLCYVPYLLVLGLILLKVAGEAIDGNGNDAFVYFIFGLFLMLTYAPIEDIRKESTFIESRMEQLDGIDTYAEKLSREEL